MLEKDINLTCVFFKTWSCDCCGVFLGCCCCCCCCCCSCSCSCACSWFRCCCRCCCCCWWLHLTVIQFTNPGTCKAHQGSTVSGLLGGTTSPPSWLGVSHWCRAKGGENNPYIDLICLGGFHVGGTLRFPMNLLTVLSGLDVNWLLFDIIRRKPQGHWAILKKTPHLKHEH